MRETCDGERTPLARIAWTKRDDKDGKADRAESEVGKRDGRDEEETNHGLA